jgi:hypothetical protein
MEQNNKIQVNTPTVQHLLIEISKNNIDASLDLARYERGLKIENCVASTEKNIYSLVLNLETEKEILKNIFLLTQRFLQANFPESAIDATASQFAQDITELRRDWILDDIILFFKFVRQRQDIPELKTYGAKITSIKLLEFTKFYEDERCDAKEKFLSQKKQQELRELHDEKIVNGFLFKTFGKEMLESLENKKETERKEKMERAVKTQKFHSENEFCLQWLKENKVDENLALSWFNIFRFRKQLK